MNPLVSVIMPMHNAATDLAEAIESIRVQTYDRWELLCLDDGSTDDTAGIVTRSAQSDARIRYIPLARGGIVPALNEGVRQARGEFVARMDADDVALPNRFQVQLDWLHRHPSWAMVGAAYDVIDADGVVWKTQRPPVEPGQVKRDLAVRNCLCHPAMLMRAECLRRFPGPYRGPFVLAEDYDLWLRVVEVYPIGNVPDVLLRYRLDLSRANPERTVVQTISQMGAQAAARARARGADDPSQNWSRVDRDTLLQHGIREEDVNYQVRRALFAEARLARRRGFFAESQCLLREASHSPPFKESLARTLDYLWRSFRVRVA